MWQNDHLIMTATTAFNLACKAEKNILASEKAVDENEAWVPKVFISRNSGYIHNQVINLDRLINLAGCQVDDVECRVLKIILGTN